MGCSGSGARGSGSGSGGSSGGSGAEKNPSLMSVTNAEDVAFIKDLKHMVDDHFAESSVRARCRQYIKRFVRIALNYEEL